MSDIVVLSHRIPYPPNKGEKIRTYNQIKHLVELGFRVTVLAPQESDEDTNHSNGLTKTLGVTCELFKTKPTWFKYVRGLCLGEPISVANFYSELLGNRLIELLRMLDVRALVCSSSAMAPYVFALNGFFDSKFIKPRLIMDFMDLDSDKWLQYAANSRPLMKWIYQRESNKIRQLEIDTVDVFDRSYFISTNEVDLFLNQSDVRNDIKKIEVVGNGLDTDAFYPSQQKNEKPAPIFLFTGVMDYKPNVDAVVWFVEHCWDSILERYPDAEFVIAGMNPNREVLELTKKSGVMVTGFVDDILPFFHKSSIFVAPFRLARGVQNKILQAFACGVAVVTTPMGAEGIACQSGTHLLLAERPGDIVQSIFNLLDNPSLKEKVEENALALIHDTYSWAAQLKPLRDFLFEGLQHETND